MIWSMTWSWTVRFSTGTIATQLTSIDSSTLTLRRREGEARSRLDVRREQLVQQYTRMEEVVSRLRAQSSSLLGSLGALQTKDR